MGDLVQLIVSGTATGAIYALAALGFTLLWQAVEKLACKLDPDCVPKEAAKEDTFEAEKWNEVVGK